MNNTLAYIKINKINHISENELLNGGKNTLEFTRIDEGDNQDKAIKRTQAFSSRCSKAGLHVFGEAVCGGIENKAAHFIKCVVSKITFIDSITTPTIRVLADNHESAFEVMDFLDSEGVMLITNTLSRFQAVSDTVSIMSAFYDESCPCPSKSIRQV